MGEEKQMLWVHLPQRGWNPAHCCTDIRPAHCCTDICLFRMKRVGLFNLYEVKKCHFPIRNGVIRRISKDLEATGGWTQDQQTPKEPCKILKAGS